MDTILDILDELKPGVDWRGRTDLVDGRELDSLTIISLIAELEDAFDVVVPAVEIVPENFNSLEGIWALVRRLREQGL
ncbi:phosphopantetheine-binding protein [Thermophilibacter provencensis]|uniref:Phosphopantetheine-binding protein n=1 Tax=Thermophilibacter provencensis TaxID=1852386 RepID=A0A921KNA9_9ACTN|nr:phosphopantetheine-binding protein [Thermophilibacter provencensis]MBM6814531.1 acyl carrier protein [Olsenella uli]HJF45656.1 phosphopantetheine-binding protein [Thermophilibacter provencensis]